MPKRPLASLGSVAFFVDGPLAVFGNAAWLHLSILGYLDEVNHRLANIGQQRLLVIGLQKTGQVVDHVCMIERFLPKNRIYALDDDYRYCYILTGRDPAANGFGDETYYGQDFLFKTERGRIFNFALPYPFPDKSAGGGGLGFAMAKVELARYGELIGRAVSDSLQQFGIVAHFQHR